jgi:predicted cupin superfamily sugar epimerase
VDASEIIAALGMVPHPEGGHYAETFRGDDRSTGRATVTAIYFLLQGDQRSHWHRVDADEIWLYHSGDPLELTIAGDRGDRSIMTLGADLAAGHVPQAVVPAGAWQSATTAGDHSLVSCVVAPGFEFSGFELAPPDWEPS